MFTLMVSNISGGTTPSGDSWLKILVPILLGAIFGLIAYWWKKRHPSPTTIEATLAISEVRGKGNVLRNITAGTLGSWLDVTVRIRKGDFYATKGGYGQEIRVEVVDIRKAEIPNRHGFDIPEDWAVELKLTVGGGIVYPGQRAVPVGVNHYLLPRVSDHDESAESVYAFHLGETYFSFECFVVTHINAHDSCADIRFASLYLEPK